MSNDAVAKPASLEDQISQFKGFATVDGEVQNDGKKTGLEKPAAGTRAQQTQPARQAAGATKEAEHDDETDPESGDTGADPAAVEGREGDQENGEAQRQQPKRSVQERINQATRKQRAAERERDEMRGRLASIEARLNAPKAGDLTTGAASASNAAGDAPDASKFEFGELDAKYIRALARWEAKQEFAEQTKNQRQTQLTAVQQEEAQRFQGLKATFEDVGSTEYGDEFQELVIEGAANGEWPMSDTLGRLALESDVGHHIAFHLATHPTEARKVFGLTAMQQAAWFGRQEAAYSSTQDAHPNNDDEDGESQPQQAQPRQQRPVLGKAASKAPAPLRNKARGNGSTARNAGESTDFAAFEAAAMRNN